MQENLSNKELAKKVRGMRSKSEFARLLGVTRPLIALYEHGSVEPSSEVWIKMARLAGYPLNIECWKRAGLNKQESTSLLHGLRIESEPRSQDSRDRLKAREALSHSYPEPVTEPLGDEPVGSEPAALRGLSTSVEQWYQRNRPPVEPVTEPLGDEPAAPARKGKRGRRKK